MAEHKIRNTIADGEVVISLSDLRAALLLNVLEIEDRDKERYTDAEEVYVAGFVNGWRQGYINLERILGKIVPDMELDVDLTRGAPDATL